jgi:vancomycin permeability regulator SanA
MDDRILAEGRVHCIGIKLMTDDQISELLFVCEEPVRGNLAMVFGAANELDLFRRMRQGVQLYQQGYVPRLLVTGGGTLALVKPAALRMADLARQLGVPGSDLLVEPCSNNTFANARESLELLRGRGLLDDLSTILLVSSEWHMRRVLLTVQKTFRPGLRFVCCPTLEGCTHGRPGRPRKSAARRCSRSGRYS